MRSTANVAIGVLSSVLMQVRRRPLLQIAAIGTITLSLIVVGAVRLGAENAGRLASSWGTDVQLVLYLSDDVTPERTSRLVEMVGHVPGVDNARLVTSHEASLRARRSLGARAALLDGVEEGFFPVSIEASLRPGLLDVIRVHPSFSRLRTLSGVEDVEVLGDWAARLRAVQDVLLRTGWALVAIIGTACLFVIAATIRLTVFARRDEIAILKLVGATDGYVRAPFLLEGAMQGALGATLATCALYGLYRLALPALSGALEGVVAAAPLAFFPATELLAAPLAGALLGIGGSYLALGRYVRV